MCRPSVKKRFAEAPNWFRSRAHFLKCGAALAALGIMFEGEQHVEEYVDWKAVSDRLRPDRGTPHLHGSQRVLGSGSHNAGDGKSFGRGRHARDARYACNGSHTDDAAVR